MTTNNRLSFKIISIIDLVLLLVSIFVNLLGIVEDSNTIQYVFNLIAVLFAIAYYFNGYKKNGNLFYRLFAGFLALKEMTAITYIGVYETVPAFTFVAFLICYGVCLVIAVAKDLGKKVTYTLAIIQIVISAFAFLFVTMNAQYISVITYNSTRLILAIILLTMAIAKYKDKEIRNTK